MKRSPLLSVLVLVLALVACRAASAPSFPPEANRLQPDHAPTPFSAQEIRAGCPEGRRNLYEMKFEGKKPFWQLSTFVVSDETGAVFEALALNENGDQIGDKASENASWEELQGHASFPAANTVIDLDRCRVPAGTFDCWRYVVTEDKDGGEFVQTFWFARDLAGPPVRFVQEQDGRLLFEMKLVETGSFADE